MNTFVLLITPKMSQEMNILYVIYQQQLVYTFLHLTYYDEVIA